MDNKKNSNPLETKIERRGGKRPNAGRKPILEGEKTKQIVVYCPESLIEKMREQFKILLKLAIEEEKENRKINQIKELKKQLK